MKSTAHFPPLLRTLVVACTLFLAFPTLAQQQPSYFHSNLNPYLINPAYAGDADGQNLYLIGRNDFLNMPEAPKYYHLTFDAALSNPRIGFGAEAFSHSAFAVKNMGFSASYRYKFQVAEKHFVSAALSAGFIQNSLDFSKIEANDPTKISDFTGIEATMRPIVNFGILYQYAQLKVGFSAKQLLASTFAYEKSLNEQDLSYYLLQQYHLSTAYRFRFAGYWAADVMLLGGSTHGLPLWGRLDATFHYDDLLWFGGGFAYESTSYLIAGIRLAEQLTCSYSYGFSTAGAKDYRSYLGATHEICLGYRIQRTSSKSKDQRLSQEVAQLQYIVENQGEEIDRLKQERLELKKQMEQHMLSKETIDSLIRQNAEHQQAMNEKTPKDTIFEDKFYVIIAAAYQLPQIKEFQKIILKNFNLETKVLDPASGQSYFLIYTDVFTSAKEAQAAASQLRKTKLKEYLIGDIWIHHVKHKTIE